MLLRILIKHHREEKKYHLSRPGPYRKAFCKSWHLISQTLASVSSKTERVIQVEQLLFAGIEILFFHWGLFIGISSFTHQL
jgi:hypothetical protein